jgi:AcrR family transcriptional regulator
MSSPPAADDRTAPRDPLSRDRVVAAAIAVLDAEGFAALSMRRVARELDTGAMSLYRHVADRDELLDLVLEELTAEVAIPESTGHWREDIAAIGRAVRIALLRRRDLTLLLTARLGRGRAALPILDRTIGVFLRAGFSPRDAVHANHALGNYVSGAATWEAVGLDGEVEPSRRAARAVESAARLAELPAGTLPNLVAVAGELFAGSGDERFEYGLAVLIDGFAARLATAHEPAPPGDGAA